MVIESLKFGNFLRPDRKNLSYEFLSSGVDDLSLTGAERGSSRGAQVGSKHPNNCETNFFLT